MRHRVLPFLLLAIMLHGCGTEESRARDEPGLQVYCAAGLRPAMEAILASWKDEYGQDVGVQYAGTGTLRGMLELSGRGDIFISAEESFMRSAVEEGLVQETMPVSVQYPVIAVLEGNPHGIHSLDDLLREDISFGMASPGATAVGTSVRRVLRALGTWEMFEARCRVFKPTVLDIASDVRIGAIDAAITWDTVALQFPGLVAVHVPELDSVVESITLGVLSAAGDPSAALSLARYVAARDRGLLEFSRRGYEVHDGDAWALVPQLTLFAGGMLNPAIDDVVSRFQNREGVQVTRVYNGCGILVSQIRSGARPDAYFSCDMGFLEMVQGQFNAPVNISENPLVILVQKGNPHGIRTPSDLALGGLKVGLAHEENSALGSLSFRLLREKGALEAMQASGTIKVESATGDFLINQMRAGGLDAAIVYRSNVLSSPHTRERTEIIAIDAAGYRALQPFAVGRESDHRFLAQRLLKAIQHESTARIFRELGFVWLEDDS